MVYWLVFNRTLSIYVTGFPYEIHVCLDSCKQSNLFLGWGATAEGQSEPSQELGTAVVTVYSQR